MLKRFGITLLAAAFGFGAVAALPGPAFARKSPLEGQPDVRHKYELRQLRFEVAPTFEATVQADYKHTVSGGLKLEYHLTRLGVPHDVKQYPNAGHAFLNDDDIGPWWLQPLFRLGHAGPEPESAADAWRRIDAFFGEHLRR